MADDVVRVVAVVDAGLEEDHPLPGDLRAAQRRIISSLLPLNIGPQTTSSQPPRCGGTLITRRDPRAAVGCRVLGRAESEIPVTS